MEYGIVDLNTLFGEGEQAPHTVQIARSVAAERIAKLETELGHPLAQPTAEAPANPLPGDEHEDL